MDNSKIFSGFRHVGQNGTQLERSVDALTAVSQENELSLRIETGAVQGIIPEIDFDPWKLRDGASLTSITFGLVEDSDIEQATGSLRFERSGRGLALTPDFSAVGAETYELILFREGKVVWRQPGSSGVAGAINNFAAGRGRACCRVLLYSTSFLTAPFTLTDGPQIEADNAFFIPEDPQVRVRAINALEFKGEGIQTLNLRSTSIAVSDPFVTYQGLGETVVKVDQNSVIAGLEKGQSGGVAVACGDVDQCQLRLSARNIDGNEAEPVRLSTSTETGTFETEVMLSGDRPRTLNLNGITGSKAEIQLSLSCGSTVVLDDEAIQAAVGEPGSMREIQTLLRSRS